jgi:hypothetical protein
MNVVLVLAKREGNDYLCRGSFERNKKYAFDINVMNFLEK